MIKHWLRYSLPPKALLIFNIFELPWSIGMEDRGQSEVGIPTDFLSTSHLSPTWSLSPTSLPLLLSLVWELSLLYRKCYFILAFFRHSSRYGSSYPPNISQMGDDLLYIRAQTNKIRTRLVSCLGAQMTICLHVNSEGERRGPVPINRYLHIREHRQLDPQSNGQVCAVDRYGRSFSVRPMNTVQKENGSTILLLKFCGSS